MDLSLCIWRVHLWFGEGGLLLKYEHIHLQKSSEEMCYFLYLFQLDLPTCGR
jgi:hypothetical protein